jgi:lipoprotein-releasing system permease protein
MIAMIGAAVGTAALVIVLSVFNGLEDLLRSLYNSFDPEIRISASAGKSFLIDQDFLEKIRKTEGVLSLTEVIEDNALVKYADGQTIVTIKGVGNNYQEQSNISKVVKNGKPVLQENGVQYALIGSSLQQILSISLDNDFYVLQVWYPRKQNASVINPETAFNKGTLKPGGIFAIEQEYDEKYMIAPLEFTEALMDYQNRRTSIEVKTKPGFSVDKVIWNLEKLLGDKFKIQDRDQQHASLYKAIRVEKFFMFITLSFILAIASLNIFFSLTMLGIEKKKDISVLFAMGATKGMVRKLFLYEGGIISFIGASIGLVLGVVLCLLQQKFGFASMGMQTSIVQAYPVKIQNLDVFFIGLSIITITFFVSFSPARKASDVNLKTNL